MKKSIKAFSLVLGAGLFAACGSQATGFPATDDVVAQDDSKSDRAGAPKGDQTFECATKTELFRGDNGVTHFTFSVKQLGSSAASVDGASSASDQFAAAFDSGFLLGYKPDFTDKFLDILWGTEDETVNVRLYSAHGYRFGWMRYINAESDDNVYDRVVCNVSASSAAKKSDAPSRSQIADLKKEFEEKDFADATKITVSQLRKSLPEAKKEYAKMVADYQQDQVGVAIYSYKTFTILYANEGDDGPVDVRVFSSADEVVLLGTAPCSCEPIEWSTDGN